MNLLIAVLFFLLGVLLASEFERVRFKKLNQKLHYHQQIWRGMFPYRSALPPESWYIVDYYGWKLGALEREPPHPEMDPEYYHTISDWRRLRGDSGAN